MNGTTIRCIMLANNYGSASATVLLRVLWADLRDSCKPLEVHQVGASPIYVDIDEEACMHRRLCPMGISSMQI